MSADRIAGQLVAVAILSFNEVGVSNTEPIFRSAQTVQFGMDACHNRSGSTGSIENVVNALL